MQKKTKTKKAKSSEEIQRANLRKILTKMKVRIAESEEIWLDTYHLLLPTVLTEWEELPEVRLEERIRLISRLTDVALEEYERRWKNEKV